MGVQPGETAAANAVRIPADVDTPDKIAFGLTGRQLLITGVGAAICYAITDIISLSLPGTIAVITPIAAVTALVVLGRRDGLPLDRWLIAAAWYGLSPRRYRAHPGGPLPPWAPPVAQTAVATLRLPATAIHRDGSIDTGTGTTVVMIAASTVNLQLRDPAEQTVLLDAFGRWLNSITTPVQITVTEQRLDLAQYAHLITTRAATINEPALRQTAESYAKFLANLARSNDIRARTIITTLTTPSSQPGAHAIQAAQHSAAALAGIGIGAQVLDGGAAIAALQAAADPFGPAHASWPRATPTTAITAMSLRPGAYTQEPTG
ncbi:PrgI family protein [Catelliglobosispora koreensis]|uniref:PrgI family protein n=1 Tax=Catelliglobosispora koreensis TaxID=129052 RepID=UPI000371AF8B|nr:PrgI family protein [Catelliglobosispora koreensis]